jgi:phasin family protein
MAHDDKEGQTTDPLNPLNPLGLPDLSKMLEQMQVPGVDFEQLAEDARKNIEALQEANRTVAEGWQTLTEKQMEIFQHTMQRWQEVVTAQGSTSPGESAEKQAQFAREGFERALENMRELAEIAAESQSKALEIMRSRFEENMRSMFQTAKDDEA